MEEKCSKDRKLENEAAPALVGVHPKHEFVSVSIGSDIRVFDLRDGSGVKLVDGDGGHRDSIRSIRFSRSGKLFVSAGDDKLVKIWDTITWRCVSVVVSEKRVNSLAISNDERFICFADKFGVVHLVDLRDYKSSDSFPINKKAVPILAHYCSIITRLEFSPDGRYIVTADRDFKIRVTVFPEEPLHGAHEIQSFCLGHTEFVSCLAFLGNDRDGLRLLVSGGGDSTVRLWDYASGSLLDTCSVIDKVEIKQDEIPPAVIDLSATTDGAMVAVAIQSFSGILLLSCDAKDGSLSIVKVISVENETFIPTSVAASSHSAPSLLWMVMGASIPENDDSAVLVRVKAVSGFASSGGGSSSSLLDDTEMPWGEKLLEELQGGGEASIGDAAFAAAAEAAKKSMRNLLIKKRYSSERREERKRGRNDKKVNRC